ncbi:MAG: cation diffusion facilitator family transporter [Muribaculaceae bacterium]|nr:cation diffusion facilitator family transporter [Muribaculaceae bacterium]
MNENQIVDLQNDLQNWADRDVDYDNGLDQLEQDLEDQLEEQMADLRGLEEDREKIGNPVTLGETVEDVIWEQFFNQLGIEEAEEFKRKNQGLPLDLRDSAHIQTAENFEQGKIAKHNRKSKEQLEQNYDRFKNKSHKEFREEKVNQGMDKVLPRAGELDKKGIETVTDIYTGRKISTKTKLENGKNNPNAAQREHVISSDELYQNPTLQMSNNDEELANVINDPNNLQGYTTAKRNNDKSNKSSDEMKDSDRTKHWEKANKKAKDFVEEKEKEGEERLNTEGRESQKAELKQIGKSALKTVFYTILADFIKEVIRQLVAWFRSGERKLRTFFESFKKAFFSFIKNIKQRLLMAGNTLVTMIASAIWGPVVGMIKKAWIFLKQGYKSVKDAIIFFKDPANKSMPFSLKMMNVGKILIAGLTAGGAILLGEVIEKGLMAIPGFAFEIPLLGNLASLLGIFFGAVVSGIVGALALNVIDRIIAKKLKKQNTEERINVGNEILETQDKLNEVAVAKAQNARVMAATNIGKRHESAAQVIKDSLERINANSEAIDKPLAESVEAEEVADADSNEKSENESKLDQIFNDLKDINNI